MLELWQGEFGDEYTERQARLDTKPVLRTLLHPYLTEIRSVLEVGCNRGDNLDAWTEAARVVGIEPNRKARNQAKNRGFAVYDGEARQLPFSANRFDLVFTAGLLIHIQPAHLGRAVSEIHRVTRRLILAIEYPAFHPTSVTYRGVRDGIWKRDYGDEYQSRFPDLTLVGEGDQDSLAGTPFDGSAWWLLEK